MNLRRTPAPASIAQRLTRTLIVWVGGIWLLGALAVTWYVAREINRNFDHELIELSHRMIDIAIDDYEDLLRDAGGARTRTGIAPAPLIEGDPIVYQLVDPEGRVQLRSREAPVDPFDAPRRAGFTDIGRWRIYTVAHPNRPLWLHLADPLAERHLTVNRTLLGLLVPMMMVLPLLAWLLSSIARRELRALHHLESEIALRSGDDLRPIPLAGMPQELQSVGDPVNRLLERLAKALDVERALAANAAHELRTPLATVRLRLQTALEQPEPHREVQAAIDALGVLSHRTERLLQLSRAESGASLAQTPIDVVQLAATVAQEFWHDASVRERLDLRLPEVDIVRPALADFDALAIALRNLVENALRYGAGKPVEIEVAAPCALIVRDFGPGVSSDQLRTLQERHVRHSGDQAGYGLGLSIVATIVQKQTAQLALASPPTGAASGFEARIVLRAA